MALIHGRNLKGFKMNLKLTFILILSGLAVIFVAQNIAAVDVSFLVWGISMPSSVLIFLTLLIGFALGWFLQSYIAYRKSRDEYEYLR